MQTSNQTVLLNWLMSSTSATIKHNQFELVRYQESEFLSKINSTHPIRCRVIFEADASSAVGDWLDNIASDACFCVLQRNNNLYGVEIALNQSSSTWTSLFPNHLAAELVQVTFPLPFLSKPGLLVMDMDSTAIQIECIDELAAMAGVGQAVSDVTASAMRGELDFEESLRLRVSKLAGADASIISQLCDNLPLMPGLEQMLDELKANQWKLVVASGGFTPFVGHLKSLLQLDADYANELVIEHNKLVGTVTGDVVDAEYKANVIQQCADTWNITPGQTVAIGDGANDIPMIKAADLGLAFHAKPKLVEAAQASIQRLDLRALVFCLQA